MNNHWKNIIGDKDIESLQIVDSLFQKYKDHKNVFRILAALQSRINEYQSEPMKSVRSFRGQKDFKTALEIADVFSLIGNRSNAYVWNGAWLDHIEMSKDSDGRLHLIGRPYGLNIDLKVLDQFKKMTENSLNVHIGADRVHFPGWTIEIDVTKKEETPK